MFSLSSALANDLENKYTAVPWEPNLAVLDYTGWKLYFTSRLFVIIHISPVPEVLAVKHQAQPQCPHPRAQSLTLKQETTDGARETKKYKEIIRLNPSMQLAMVFVHCHGGKGFWLKRVKGESCEMHVTQYAKILPLILRRIILINELFLSLINNCSLQLPVYPWFFRLKFGLSRAKGDINTLCSYNTMWSCSFSQDELPQHAHMNCAELQAVPFCVDLCFCSDDVSSLKLPETTRTHGSIL